MEVKLEVRDPSDSVRDAILAPLMGFNAANGYPPDPQSLAITLTDPSGAVLGGLWGKTVYDWLSVEYLVVPETLRGSGLGARLMTQAEQIAIDRGCVGAWLTTFPFQAQGFYEKLGYEVFARLDRSPRDNERIFMRKTLRA
jgi:GNAT superfamily N-acetyltransferase